MKAALATVIILNNAHQRGKWRERFLGPTAVLPFLLDFYAFRTGLLTTAERFRGSLEQKWQQTRKSKNIQT